VRAAVHSRRGNSIRSIIRSYRCSNYLLVSPTLIGSIENLSISDKEKMMQVNYR
jgi:hypothetical protein